MYKISDKITNLISKAMENWRVELTVGGQTLPEVKLQRGIFQGDSLLLLLFVVAIMLFNHVLRKCT